MFVQLLLQQAGINSSVTEVSPVFAGNASDTMGQRQFTRALS